MRVLVIEDELPAANRLIKLLEGIIADLEIVNRLDSVESVVNYLESAKDIDLIFMDIQLADGLCFNVFEQVQVNTPVIFTTAFDQYTLKAFKVNSIDYLLKPIDEIELQKAVIKFKSLNKIEKEDQTSKILKILDNLNTVKYKERILIRSGQQLTYIKTENIAYCFATGKYCFAVDFSNNQHLVDQNLTELETELNPAKFYRVNRNLIVAIDSLSKVHLWFGSRLKLDLVLPTSADTVVSRERVNGFKEWLGGK